MRTSLRRGLFAVLTLGCTLSAHAAEPNGFIPNGPAVWSKFEGDGRNYGTGQAKWLLENVAYQEGALYINGKYRTPLENSGPGYRALCSTAPFAKERYTVALRFKRDLTKESRTILTGGTGYRWFSIGTAPQDGLEVIFNNNQLSRPVEGVKVRPEEWNWLICSVDVPARKCLVFLNGQAAQPIALPADFELNVPPPAERRDNTWSFTNLSNSRTFAGWVDEFLFYARPLTLPELTGLAQRRDMLDPQKPVLNTPPATPVTPAGDKAPAAALSQLSKADLQDRPGVLEISSVGSTFAVVGRLTGSYTWNAARVKVHIKRGEILRQEQGLAPERNIESFKLYVRRENPAKKSMDIVGRSEAVPVDAAITHGLKAEFDDIEVEIPLPGISPAELGQMWMGMWITETHDAINPAEGKPRRQEGICIAEAKTRLNGQPRPEEVKLGKN